MNSTLQEVPHGVEEAAVRLVFRGQQRLQAEDLNEEFYDLTLLTKLARNEETPYDGESGWIVEFKTLNKANNEIKREYFLTTVFRSTNAEHESIFEC